MEEKRDDKNGNFGRFLTQSISDKKEGIKNLKNYGAVQQLLF